MHPEICFFHNTESFVLACVVKRGRFLISFFQFLCCKTDKKSKKIRKNAKKIKKMQKNKKKCKKNLRISKKSCTFALDFGKIPETTTKNNPIRNPKI